MNTIIYDSKTQNTNRFPAGVEMKFIETNTLKLKNQYYEVTTLKCCSPVKTTKNNWYYLMLPETNKELCDTWIKEIAPMFPSLNIQMVEFDRNNIIKPTYAQYPQLTYHNGTKAIEVDLPLSEESNKNYGHTNKRRSPISHFSSLPSLLYSFIEYIIKNKTILTPLIYEVEIETFVKKELKKSIKEYLQQPNSATRVRLMDTSDTYGVYTSLILDFDNLPADALTKYLKEVVAIKTNLNNICAYVSKKVGKEEKPIADMINLVQAHYSKKSYSVEAYLAHHLIRAGICKDFEPFINQYFTIKKAVPELYFWNLIFLTQFGFQFYYYYWLTENRHFKLITPEVFEAAAEEYEDYSSKGFLGNFHTTYSTGTLSRLEKLYKEGEFAKIIEMLSCSFIVAIKPEKKEKFINLRLSDNYGVTSIEEDYYFITGDDYKMRRYKQSNFNIIDRIKI